MAFLFAPSEACFPIRRADGICFSWVKHWAGWFLRSWPKWSLYACPPALAVRIHLCKLRALYIYIKKKTFWIHWFLVFSLFPQTLEEPPYLTVGTDVSAKYRGAFCEAKIKTAKRLVKAKVSHISKCSWSKISSNVSSVLCVKWSAAGLRALCGVFVWRGYNRDHTAQL